MPSERIIKSIPDWKQLSKMSEDGMNIVQRVPLWGSCRLVYTICAFLTMLNLILMRFNLSFALVCMVKDPMVNITGQWPLNTTLDTEDNPELECPVSSSSTASLHEGEFEWSKSLQGRILSGFFYGYVISQGFGGWFSDRFGGKLFFILGNFLQSLITLILPMAARFDPEALFILRILQGIVCGLSLPSIFQLYTRWASPDERTTLMGVAYTGFPLGNVIIFPLSGLLCQLGAGGVGGWPYIFYATGIFGVLCSIAFYFLVFDNANKHPRITEKERIFLNSCTIKDSKEPLKVPWRAIIFSTPVHAYNIAHFCYTWGFITLAVNLPLFMKEVLLFDLNQNGVLSAMPYLGVFIIRIFISTTFTPLQKKLASHGISLTTFRKIYHTIGTLGAGTCMLAVTALSCRDQYVAVLLITLSQAVADFAFTGGYLLSYLEMAPQFAGLLTGASNTIGTLPGVLAPTLVGILTPNGTRDEWMIVIYVTAGFYFLGTVSYLLLGSSELQPWAIMKPISTTTASTPLKHHSSIDKETAFVGTNGL